MVEYIIPNKVAQHVHDLVQLSGLWYISTATLHHIPYLDPAQELAKVQEFGLAASQYVK